MEATQVPIDRQMNKEVVDKYGGILLSHEKEWNLAIWDNMDIMLSDINQSEQNKQRRIPLICEI